VLREEVVEGTLGEPEDTLEKLFPTKDFAVRVKFVYAWPRTVSYILSLSADNTPAFHVYCVTSISGPGAGGHHTETQ